MIKFWLRVPQPEIVIRVKMSVPSDLPKLKAYYETVSLHDSRKEEFSEAVSGVARSILGRVPRDASPIKKAEVLTEAFLKADFTEEQIKILKTSGDPVIHEAAKLLAIEKYIQEKFPEDGLGCCRLIIMREGDILFTHTSGKADATTPASLAMPQHYGSVSKQFTAACIADLVLKGDLSLDTDIRTILTGLPPFMHDGKEVVVTVDHLLQMRSGLPDCVNLAFLRGIHDQDLTQSAKMAPLYNMKSLELSFPPNERFHYCNTNYYLLSDIVEGVSGKNLRAYAEERVFIPLGMRGTGFIDSSRGVEEQSIPGYSGDGRLATTKNTTWGACGVIGVPEEMVIWDGEAPKQPYWALLTEEPEDGIYARGLHVEKVKDRKAIFHPGGIEGFQTMYLRLEKQDSPEVSVFLAATKEGYESDKWARDIANIYLEEVLFEPPEEPLSGSPPLLLYDPSEMAGHVGTYHSDMLEVNHSIEIVQVDSRFYLKMKPNDAGEEFSFLFGQDVENPNKFVSVGQIKGAEITFTEDGFIFQDSSLPIPPIKFRQTA